MKHDTKTSYALMYQVLLFGLPILVLVFSAEVYLWRAGDSYPVLLALEKQKYAEGELLYGRSYLSQQFGIYKAAAIRFYRPKILALGSSRVMQFRKEMFFPAGDDFYNAGGMVRSAHQLRHYVSAIREGQFPRPRVVIVGLDPWWLKPSADKSVRWDQRDAAFSFAAHVEAYRRLFKRLVKGQGLDNVASNALSPYLHIPAIGSLARMRGNGFRRDGSRQYSPAMLLEFRKYPLYVDRENPPVIERVKNGLARFGGNQDLSGEQTEELIRAMIELRSTGIEVHALFPPVSTEVFAALNEKAHRWWLYYRNKLPKVLANHDIVVTSVLHPGELGKNDLFMIDGFHASEVLVAAILEQIIRHSRTDSLLRAIDRDALSQMVKHAESPLSFTMPTL